MSMVDAIPILFVGGTFLYFIGTMVVNYIKANSA